MILRPGGFGVRNTGFAVRGASGQDCGCCGPTGCAFPPCVSGTNQSQVLLAWTGTVCTIACVPGPTEGSSCGIGIRWESIPQSLLMAYVPYASVPSNARNAFGPTYQDGSGCAFRSANNYNYIIRQCSVSNPRLCGVEENVPVGIWVTLTEVNRWRVFSVPVNINAGGSYHPILRPTVGQGTLSGTSIPCGSSWLGTASGNFGGSCVGQAEAAGAWSVSVSNA